ncbi:gamma-glutamyltransferase family protein [Mycolicibacterium sp. J2]|uniref:gamma-glutamyltransferase family protein n=1 Tax=Mycolicibacterium sp. J2 TaxID=2993511 RepID=UPI00224A56DA|nr:gamma-glutamyltransferase [Mycolicibacterium sp. J2]MCX2710484.1 gamma-glutamyltransferase [Mycolicibacterium sp. J2]
MPTTNGASPFTGAIATPHVLATEAATAAYRDGGNAIDAAIAAAAVLTVVYPHNVALGGDLIALVRTPDGTMRCVNASGWSGAAADVARMRATHGDRLPIRGADSITVPGGVRGWETLRSFGSRLSWDRLLRPAEQAAEIGVPVAPSLGRHLRDPENADLFAMADFERVFGPGGQPVGLGERLHQSALAATLRTLAAAGPDEFYIGGLADRTVEYLRSHGSVLDDADFAEFRPEITDPIAMDFHGLTVLTSPPNTHGFVMLRALTAIRDLGLDAPLGGDLATVMRIFHEANRLRATRLADPRLAQVDVPALVSGNLAAVAALGSTAGAAAVPRGDTVGVAAADADGFAVSLIQSVYHAFGSGLIDPQTGILFHNRGTSFALDPSSPNVLAPRKRPLHTLMPVLTTRDGAVAHVLATMGGQGQPQILTQVLLRMLDGASAADAVAAPRAVVGQQVGDCTDDTVLAETDVDPAALRDLAAAGLDVVATPRYSEGLGQANVVQVGDNGQLVAASDPRADGSAVVVQFPLHQRTPGALT